MTDPRVSDEATGLPPLEELGNDPVMLVLAWATGNGIASNDFTDSEEPCRFLHLRGLVVSETAGYSAEWAQIHFAIPVEAVMDLAADLVRGRPE
jgi:hypothetical protein